MRHARVMAIIAGLLALNGCQRTTTQIQPAPAPVIVEAVEELAWRQAATEQDLDRLERLEDSWAEALSRAKEAGFERQLAGEGALFDPQAALPRPVPPPGSYSCRLLRLGKERPRSRFFTAYPPFFCYVRDEGEQLSLTKQTGSERPGGYLWEDENPRRLIFLGAAAVGKQLAAYGENVETDRAGVFERVGPMRFRLVTPRIQDDLVLDVYELTPAPVQP